MTEKSTQWTVPTPNKSRSTLVVVVVLMAATFLLSGCSWFNRDESNLGIDYTSLLPVEWEPLGSWQSVNIDEDETPEYLLFYRYEGGQVGGVIYDPQTNTEFAPVAGAPTSLALPNQPSVSLIPYRLLPSYWRNAGEGFIAGPGQVPTFIQVQRPAEQVVGDKDNDRVDEVIIFGDANFLTHLTIVWWQGPAKGYGVTHLAAPGGLDITDWSGQDNASTVVEVDGYFPEENSRSLLCRKVTYDRAVPADTERDADDYRYTLGFTARPQGLTFCPSDRFATGTPYPTYTYYPEATVLAFLLHPQTERVNTKSMKELVSGDAALLEKIDGWLGESPRVQSLTYYTTLGDVETSADAFQKETMQMNVVAELVVTEDDQVRTRFITFVLQHQPPSFDGRRMPPTAGQIGG